MHPGRSDRHGSADRRPTAQPGRRVRSSRRSARVAGRAQLRALHVRVPPRDRGWAWFTGRNGALFGLGALCLVPVLAVTGVPLLQSAGSLGITAYLAIGPMFVAYLLFGHGLGTVRGSTATSITLVEPLVATLLAVLIVGERLPLSGWAGLGLVPLAVTALVTAGGLPVRSPR
ncbi:MAG: EamA family transporter [Cryobacterium sp.]|nr:EamA family transporter [Cryobacterium sp.]